MDDDFALSSWSENPVFMMLSVTRGGDIGSCAGSNMDDGHMIILVLYVLCSGRHRDVLKVHVVLVGKLLRLDD